jgi:formate-dependent nitrite reductase membrane component NrfD
MIRVLKEIDLKPGVAESEASVLQTELPAVEKPPDPTYYNKPVIKTPVWIWTVPLYFYVGGVSGAALVLGAASRLIGDPVLRPLARKCHLVGFVGGGIGSMLLIADLGRPERFLAMLRVLKVRSPMSIGSWILAITPPVAGAAAVFGDRATSFAAGMLGVPLAGYTGVLLSNTVVPVWNETRTSLPFLFMASAVASAAQVLKLLELPPDAQTVVNTFGIAGSIIELAAGHVVEQQASRVPAVGKPLREGLSGVLWKASKLLTVAGIVLSIFPQSRRAYRAGAILGTAGSIAMRFAIFHAGKASAREPRATFHAQHQTAIPS